MKKILLLVLLVPFVLTSQTKKDTLFTNGVKKVSLNLSKPISVYFINGKQYATASTSTIRTIAGVGKVTFTSTGAITFTPYSASYNGDWVFYVKDYKLFEYNLAVCKKPTIATPIIRDTTLMQSIGLYATYVIIKKPLICQTSGVKQFAILNVFNTYFYGHILDTSVNVPEQFRFTIKGDYYNEGYPFGTGSKKVLATWTANLTRQQWLYIRENACYE
jgi:hypothetical protein